MKLNFLYFQNINAIIAEKMSIERSRDYMNARRVAKELEVQIRGINRNAPSIPPSGTPEERKQVKLIYLLLKYILHKYIMYKCLGI